MQNNKRQVNNNIYSCDSVVKISPEAFLGRLLNTPEYTHAPK